MIFCFSGTLCGEVGLGLGDAITDGAGLEIGDAITDEVAIGEGDSTEEVSFCLPNNTNEMMSATKNATPTGTNGAFGAVSCFMGDEYSLS